MYCYLLVVSNTLKNKNYNYYTKILNLLSDRVLPRDQLNITAVRVFFNFFRVQLVANRCFWNDPPWFRRIICSVLQFAVGTYGYKRFLQIIILHDCYFHFCTTFVIDWKTSTNFRNLMEFIFNGICVSIRISGHA
jgi:hypothetical protein